MKLMITPIKYITQFSDWITYSAENFLYVNSFGGDVLKDKATISDLFSTSKLNENKWYVFFILNTILYNKEPRLIKVSKELTGSNIIELKLRFDNILVISHSDQDLVQYNITCAKYITYDKDLRVTTLLTRNDFDCIVFIESFEEAIIKYVRSNSGIKYVCNQST